MFFMARKDKILKLVNKSGVGIEIGPSYNPVASKKSGYNVEIIDYMNRDELVAHYRGHNVPVEIIEDVDYVWKGESYQVLTGKTKYYDWVIASHVIEHTPNLVGFLTSCDQILKDEGVLSLAIPDYRYCFDCFRSPTSLAQVLDAHYQNRIQPSAGSTYEYHLNAVSKGNQIAWGQGAKGEYKFVHHQEAAQKTLEQALQGSSYIDAHVWCFTPSSFRLLIYDLYVLRLIQFQECSFFSTAGHEFFITLGRKRNYQPKDRLTLLKQFKSELSM